MAVQVIVGITYKVAAQSGHLGRGFGFSTTSACAIAEFIKLCISCGFYFFGHQIGNSSAGGVKTQNGSMEGLSPAAAAHILTLSFLYSVNNQLSLFVYTMADSATVFLFKAGSTFFVALTQFLLLGRRLEQMQWTALAIQMGGMVCVQFNPCTGLPVHSPLAYALLSLSALITAITTVRNEYIVKHYNVSLHVQSMVMYGGGVILNVLAFALVPNPNNAQQAIGFFEGYTTWPAVGVVLLNALIGLAVTAVYRYADAMAKAMATDCTTIILMVFNSLVLGFPSTPITWVGVCNVLLAIHLYHSGVSRQRVEAKSL